MILKKELVGIVLTLLKDDLERIADEQESNPATESCAILSKNIINKLENDNLFISSGEYGYVDILAYNYFPKNIEEHRKIIDLNYYMIVNGIRTIFPVKTLEELEKGFEFIMESSNAKGIAVHIEMPDLEKPEIIMNPKENFAKKLEYYKKAYTDDLKLKTFDKIKIVGYELV